MVKDSLGDCFFELSIYVLVSTAEDSLTFLSPCHDEVFAVSLFIFVFRLLYFLSPYMLLFDSYLSELPLDVVARLNSKKS